MQWFTWSRETGIVPIFGPNVIVEEAGAWHNVMAMSDDGYTLITSVLDPTLPTSEVPQGANFLDLPTPGGHADLSVEEVTHYALSPDGLVEGVPVNFTAAYNAVSENGYTVGGSMERFADGMTTPMLWRAGTDSSRSPRGGSAW